MRPSDLTLSAQIADDGGMGDTPLDLSGQPSDDDRFQLLELRAGVATDIADGRSLDLVLNVLVAALTDRIPGSAAAVITLDADDVTDVRASSTSPRITRLLHGARRRAWFGSWGAALTRHNASTVTEVGESSLYREHRARFVEHGLLASTASPLRGRHHVVVGAIVLYLPESRVLTPAEADLFETVGELGSLALRRDESTRELLDRIRFDPLTGLENRDGLEETLRNALGRVGDNGPGVGLLFVDIDDLTLVNDSLGHTAGDTVIATTAGRISDQLMRTDAVVRFGGDEFIVVLDRIDSIADARAVAERIRKAIADPIEIDGNALTTTVSIGITLGRRDTPPLQLIDEGHAAVVRAKQMGRGSTTEHDRVLDTGAGERLDREMQLREALTGGAFAIHWQPKVDITSGRIAGAEALVRWNDPELGIIGPDQFIATAERAGMINELSDWVLRQALTEATEIVAVDPDFSVAVNLSASQMARPEIVDMVRALLDEHDLASENVIIELTESVLAEPVVTERLHQLRAAGIRIAIDDFGTGYSSLAYVRQLPVQIVKVDRAFLDGLQADGTGAPVLAAAIAMAQALGLRTTVEGVETEDQRSGLLALRVDWAQGYLFAEPRPMPALLDRMRD